MSAERVRTFEEMLPRVVREWEHAGLDCLLIRMPDYPHIDRTKRPRPGWHCGYVRLPDGCYLPDGGGRPDGYDEAPDDIQNAAHGGLTFCGTPFSKSDGTWYGFDMAHCFDVEFDPEYEFGRYLHTDDDAIAATERLADAIAGHVGRKS